MEGKKEAKIPHEDITWDSDPNEVNYNSNSALFEEFFPSLKGKAQILDELLHRDSKNSRQESPWKRRMEKDKIVFHHEDANDPDKLVSTLLFSSLYN
jgi:hypothetical protein